MFNLFAKVIINLNLFLVLSSIMFGIFTRDNGLTNNDLATINILEKKGFKKDKMIDWTSEQLRKKIPYNHKTNSYALLFFLRFCSGM